MVAQGLQDVSKPAPEEVISVVSLAELTGFPVDYIKKELLLDGADEQDMTIEELRKRVLAYLDSSF
jgi:hypothetical protein